MLFGQKTVESMLNFRKIPRRKKIAPNLLTNPRRCAKIYGYEGVVSAFCAQPANIMAATAVWLALIHETHVRALSCRTWSLFLCLGQIFCL